MVVLEERDLESRVEQFGHVDLALRGPLQRAARLREAIAVDVACGKVEVWKGVIGIEHHGFPGFFFRGFEFAKGRAERTAQE